MDGSEAKVLFFTTDQNFPKVDTLDVRQTPANRVTLGLKGHASPSPPSPLGFPSSYFKQPLLALTKPPGICSVMLSVTGCPAANSTTHLHGSPWMQFAALPSGLEHADRGASADLPPLWPPAGHFSLAAGLEKLAREGKTPTCTYTGSRNATK